MTTNRVTCKIIPDDEFDIDDDDGDEIMGKGMELTGLDTELTRIGLDGDQNDGD